MSNDNNTAAARYERRTTDEQRLRLMKGYDDESGTFPSVMLDLEACERALAAAVERATLFEVAHNTLKEQRDALRAEVSERTYDLKRALEGIDHLRAEVEALKARQQPQEPQP